MRLHVRDVLFLEKPREFQYDNKNVGTEKIHFLEALMVLVLKCNIYNYGRRMIFWKTRPDVYELKHHGEKYTYQY